MRYSANVVSVTTLCQKKCAKKKDLQCVNRAQFCVERALFCVKRALFCVERAVSRCQKRRVVRQKRLLVRQKNRVVRERPGESEERGSRRTLSVCLRRASPQARALSNSPKYFLQKIMYNTCIYHDNIHNMCVCVCVCVCRYIVVYVVHLA